MTLSDEEYYKRLAIRKKLRESRIADLRKKVPRRLEILKQVKEGNMSLKEAQAIIKLEEK